MHLQKKQGQSKLKENDLREMKKMKKVLWILMVSVLFSGSVEAKMYKSEEVSLCKDEKTICDKKGKLVSGVVKWYLNNKRVGKEIPFRKGLKHGTARVFYETGRPMRETSYQNGLKHGNSTLYYEDGRLKQRMSYKKGKADGVEKNYYKSGRQGDEVYYQNGKAISGFTRAEKGKRRAMTKQELESASGSWNQTDELDNLFK